MFGTIANTTRSCAELACSTSGRPERQWSGQCLRYRQGRLRRIRKASSQRVRAGGDVVGEGDDSLGGDKVDIDLLASQLSQEAEKLRRAQQASGSSIDGDEELLGPVAENLRSATGEVLRSFETETSPPGSPPGPFGYEDAAKILAELGDGGFSASEFELLTQLGRLSWVVESAKDNPLQVKGATSPQQTAVIAFTGRYYSGRPFQEPVTVFVKEYLPGALAVAVNELQVMKQLLGDFPDDKWKAAITRQNSVPVIPLLGYFMAGQSEVGQTLGSGEGPQTLWLVYRWERMQPLSYYALAEQPAPPGPAFLWGKPSADESFAARCRMVRKIARGAVEALAYCHERGVAHGSLGSGSILLSTFDDRKSADLVVKLDNFGFARMQQVPGLAGRAGLYPGPLAVEEEHPLRLAQKEDLQALGLAILETVFCALADGCPSDKTCGDALSRLLLDIYDKDTRAFRKYCLAEPDWASPTLLLDEFDGAGWKLLGGLLEGTSTARDHLANEFCNVQ